MLNSLSLFSATLISFIKFLDSFIFESKLLNFSKFLFDK